MILDVKNLGRIKEARVEINAVTVIAGENNSGKSTIGKALFCFFNSLYRINEQIAAERLSNISRIIGLIRIRDGVLLENFFAAGVAEYIIENKDKYIDNMELLRKEIASKIVENEPRLNRALSDDMLENVADKIMQVINVSDDELSEYILQKKFLNEFQGQINNLYNPEATCEIALSLSEDMNISFTVEDNEAINSLDNISIINEAIYIDDSYILDVKLTGHMRRADFYPHRLHLYNSLTERVSEEDLSELLTLKRLNKILDLLNTVCPGKLDMQPNKPFAYKDKSNSFNMRNVSAGLKTFLILKTLLLNGSLQDNSILILDEPEIHLHPEWQLILAEIIVLIQKEFSLHVLVNTHSPYFLNAIEVYALIHGISEKCKYYLSENTEGTSFISDVTENIEKIYAKLARPLQVLEDRRYIND